MRLLLLRIRRAEAEAAAEAAAAALVYGWVKLDVVMVLAERCFWRGGDPSKEVDGEGVSGEAMCSTRVALSATTSAMKRFFVCMMCVV